MSDNNGQHLLDSKDFVKVVDEDGNDLGYSVPKHWGADQLAPGTKKKSSGGSRKATAPAESDDEPAGNGTPAS